MCGKSFSLVPEDVRCHIPALSALGTSQRSTPGLSANQRRLNKILSSCIALVAKSPSDLGTTAGDMDSDKSVGSLLLHPFKTGSRLECVAGGVAVGVAVGVALAKWTAGPAAEPEPEPTVKEQRPSPEGHYTAALARSTASTRTSQDTHARSHATPTVTLPIAPILNKN